MKLAFKLILFSLASGALMSLGFLAYQFHHSFARVYLDQQNLRVDFYVLPWERAYIDQSLVKNNLNSGFLNGLSFSVDDRLALALKPYLPKLVRFSYHEEALSLNEIHINPLDYLVAKPTLGLEKYQFGSGSAVLKVNRLSDSGWSLLADNPERILSEATSSGILHLAPKLQADSWQLLAKLSKIGLWIGPRQLKGEVVFK